MKRPSAQASSLLIQSSVSLPHCWVCEKPFFGSGGADPTVVKHTHHVVPQAAGGRDGPTVTICTHHHDLLHRIAEAWMPIYRSGKTPVTDVGSRMLRNEPTNFQRKIQYLALVVTRSLLAVEDDPNKLKSATVTLTGEDQKKIIALQSVHKMSREDLLLYLLRQEHARTFPLQR